MMAKKEIDFRSLTTDQLEKQLSDTREELMKLRFQVASGELTDTSRMRITRRQIARIATILHEMTSKTEGEA